MKTLTVTQARASLGRLCDQVQKGEEIGIIWGNRIFMLLPVEVKPMARGEISIIPMDEMHLEKEYGVTAKAFEEFKTSQKKRYMRHKRKGSIVSFKGKFDSSVLD